MIGGLLYLPHSEEGRGQVETPPTLLHALSSLTDHHHHQQTVIYQMNLSSPITPHRFLRPLIPEETLGTSGSRVL